MSGSRPSRWWRGLGIGLMVFFGLSDAAHADPARPGNTRSVVDALVPFVPGVDVAIVGGDAFVEVRAHSGVDVKIPGYAGEPYLWIREDSTVWENRSSPAVAINTDRYLTDVDIEIPTEIDSLAPADWHQIADDGRVLWHDHRAHWMGRSDPPTIDPSGLVQRWEFPVEVSGRLVMVEGSLYREPAPTSWWWSLVAVGAVAGFALGRVPGRVAVLIALVSGVWSIVAWWAWFGLVAPARAAPAIGVLTVVGALGAVAAWWSRQRTLYGPFLAGAATAMVIAGWQAHDGVTSALIPGLDPTWIWRMVVPFALGAALVAAAIGVKSSLRPMTPARSDR